VFPHFADGGGWTTQIVLVNPTDSAMIGSVQFRDQAGQAAMVSIGSPVREFFEYTIAAGSSQKLQTSGSSASALAGSVPVVPAANGFAPSGVAIFSFQNAGTTVAEASGNFAQGAVGSIQTGFAVSNLSGSVATVTVELSTLNGSSTGLVGTLTIPANGQSAIFLNQISGLGALAIPFQGVLRVSSAASISVVALRGRYNERRDFLITTLPPVNETAPASSSALYFPHIADSGGYTTQFILFSGRAGQASSGGLTFFRQSGSYWTLSLR